MSRKSPSIDIASTGRYNEIIPMGLPAGRPYHKRHDPAAREESFARLYLPHTHTYAQILGMVPVSTFFVPEAVIYD